MVAVAVGVPVATQLGVTSPTVNCTAFTVLFTAKLPMLEQPVTLSVTLTEYEPAPKLLALLPLAVGGSIQSMA